MGKTKTNNKGVTVKNKDILEPFDMEKALKWLNEKDENGIDNFEKSFLKPIDSQYTKKEQEQFFDKEKK